MRTSARSDGRATRLGRFAAGGAGPFEPLEQRRAVALVDDVAHVGEPLDERVERVDDRPAVLAADVLPDRGMARRDAGHVAEAARGEAQQRGVLLGAILRDAHQRGRGQVRHV